MARKYVLGPNAARKLAELLRGSGEVSRRQGPASALAFDSEYVAPFTVQWAQSADSGSGAWLVWLPSDKCLIVDGTVVDLTEELEAADDPYPTGWYVLEDVPASGGSVYLNVTPGDPEAAEEEDQVATAEFSASASQTEGDIPILVATVAKDSTTGAVTVKQTVSSALVFGTGKGVGVAAESVPAPFDYVETVTQQGGQDVVTKSITRCVFYFDGQLQSLSDYSALPNPSGTVYLVCTGTLDPETDEYAWTFALQNQEGSASTGTKVLNVKLYDFSAGKPSVDYRSTFLTINQAVGFGEKTFTFDDVDVAKILADDDIDVGQKTLEAGSGISLTVSADGKKITISATGGGGSTSGYTGTRTILADTDYDASDKRLRRRYITEDWANGVMTSQTLGAWEYYHQAVEETV